jgi:hypothetical protein
LHSVPVRVRSVASSLRVCGALPRMLLGSPCHTAWNAVTLDAVALRHSRCSSRLSFTFFFCVGSVSPVPFPFSAFCAGVVRGFRLFANASVVSTSNFLLFAGGPACTMHVGRIYAHARAHKHEHGTSETPVPSPIWLCWWLLIGSGHCWRVGKASVPCHRHVSEMVATRRPFPLGICAHALACQR